MSSKIVIEARNLSCHYRREEEIKPALLDLTLLVKEGDFVLVSGPIGAGKSTLLGCMSGMIPSLVQAEVSREVLVLGEPVSSYDRGELAKILGVVLDDPDSQLFGATVFHYLAFGPELRQLPREEIFKRVEEAAGLMGISNLLDRDIGTLSGGEKQRAVVASMLVMRPRVMILDEPTSQLDPEGTCDLFSALKRLNREYGLTIVIASQKISEICKHATSLVVLEKGTLLANGEVRKILEEQHQNRLRYPEAADFYLSCQRAGISVDGGLPLSIDEGIALTNRLLRGEKRSS